MQCRDGIESWDDQYVDDGVIECAHSDVEHTYANLEAALGPSGLRLNAKQTPHLDSCRSCWGRGSRERAGSHTVWQTHLGGRHFRSSRPGRRHWSYRNVPQGTHRHLPAKVGCA
eukprot:6486483-Amphidinium_carterae.1